MKRNSLDSFEMEFEEMEKKRVNKATTTNTKTPKTALKTRIAGVIKAAERRFDNLKPAKKNKKKMTKVEQKIHREQRKRGIIGIGLLLVVVSITYSTYMTNLFVDGPLMWAVLTPQIMFAVTILLIAFYKIYK